MEHPRKRHCARLSDPRSSQGEAPLKRQLAEKLNRVLDARGLSQAEAAGLLAIPQPRVSAIRHYKLRGISLQRLMQALADLGHRVQIVVSATDRPAEAKIDVAA
ncbi:MAG: helix-turn-helix transcriptional regulator [Vicinamibacterales bacterium]